MQAAEEGQSQIDRVLWQLCSMHVGMNANEKLIDNPLIEKVNREEL